ncbi:Predicted arabinose efflux permease, MFS family [Amycolatopsis sacchari]|uniref:Predicted arabinose efflux permease, MFS family n=2 Tax=Amycolatopsis sacchari TaxID=115433 RepID=A0A1I3QDH4_9PSEU|nr:Predicted arabinose efflux permease, MFS family [Amycolatopsis sacchari]
MRRTVPPMLRALGNHNYRLWALADVVSVTGGWMQVLGLNWVVLARTGSATAVGFSVLISTLPALLLGPWAGALADRFPPRRLIVAGEVAHLVIALLLAFLVWRELPLTPIYALTAAGGLVSTLEGPALGRFAGQVVPRDDLGNALALGSLSNAIGRVLGMSLAGALAATVGDAPLFLINAASFLFVLGTLAVMRPGEFHPLAVSPPEEAGVRAGLVYLRGHRVLLVLFALGFVLSALGRNYQVTMAAMTEGPLHAGAGGYGALSTVFAVGTVLGGVLAARVRELTVPLLLAAGAVTSVLQAVSGYAPGLLGFAVVILPIAAGAVVIDTAKSTRLQLDAAEGMRGRVLAVHGTIAAGAGAVGAPLLGWLCESLGPREALLVAGLVTLAVTAVAAAALRKPRVAEIPVPEPALATV